ncbi:efflux RND transporter periplasmic adaptor subunit [Henriciella barbarensis]|uniref:Efflux RND transporter periplasmic adaptor subunit n=1 Tax=Henriciella barbarensis TaxID=86342 RepID=A0A399R0R4_9PROT|nr:efflux RND transporter periplasmic adaptor subunit [Henriciella barbarensis]RIJ23352.1 efflux RND transporter periplasmic adaptor subunit [Henriciella barbarensis]
MSEYDRTPRPSFLKGLLFIAVIAVGVALLALFVLSQRSSDGPLVISEEPVPLAVDVVVADVQSSLALDEKFTGIIQPRRSSDLGFADGGRIAALNVDVGDRVTDGQILAVLDTRALRSQLASAEARVNEARASHALAMNTVERQQTLMQRGHVSQQRVDEALAQAATADARIEAAKAQADTLRVQIDLASIRAPYPGMIMARNYDEGAIAPRGTPVFALIETGSLEARLGLPANLASTLEPGKVYALESDGGPIDARLRSVTGVIEAGQRSVTTVFDVTDPATVSPGAVVRLSLSRDVEENGLWLPVSALAEGQRGLWSLYIAAPQDGGWIARPGLVEVVQSDGERAFVRGAISDGDRIIIDGLQRVTPGQAVSPRPAPLAASYSNEG